MEQEVKSKIAPQGAETIPIGSKEKQIKTDLEGKKSAITFFSSLEVDVYVFLNFLKLIHTF